MNKKIIENLNKERAHWEADIKALFHQCIEILPMWISVIPHGEKEYRVIRYFTLNNKVMVSVDYEGDDLANAYRSALEIVMEIG